MDLSFSKKVNSCKFWSHIPGIFMDPPFEFYLDEFIISPLSFEKWDNLDGDYPDPVDYNDTNPVFLTGEIIRTNNNQNISEIHAKILENVYTALLLQTGLFLPSPKLSCSYFKPNNDPNWYIIGRCGREWILAGAWKLARWGITEENLQLLPVIWKLIKSTVNFWDEFGLTDLINTLKLTAQPDVVTYSDEIIYANQFLLLVSTLEKHILPSRDKFPKNKTITSLFGENLALLVDNTDPNFIAKGSSIYRLRSKIIHGEVNDNNLSKIQQKLAIDFRHSYCQIILNLMHQLQYYPKYRNLKIYDLISP